jgi:6,7-dimethyl-8-ribityllumazine synthase
MAKFLIVEARFYDHLNDLLVAGAKAALEDAGHKADVITVPGALEIPGTIAMAF